MKLTKKLLSMLIALTMVFTLAIPSFAADEGSITIDNAEIGQTYTIYKILNLESYNAAKDNYAYTIADGWEEFVNNDATEYLKVEDGYVTWITDENAATVEAFAKLAKKYAEDNDIDPSVEAKKATSAAVSFTDLDLGYYLVDTTLGALCSLNTTKPNVTMSEKNAAPTITKQVQEDSKVDEEGEGWGTENDADIGDTVNFKVTVKAQKGAENYIVHDTMSTGLTFKNDVAITGLIKNTDYEVVGSDIDGCDKNCTFHIIFKQTYLDTLTEEQELVITYSATLNDKAKVGSDGNPNTVKLQYGDNNSVEATTKTYTWDMGVLKYGNGDEANALKGAKFILLNSNESKVAKFADGKLVGWDPYNSDGDLTAYELETGENGKIEIKGLDADTYKLLETKAPDGYNKLKDPKTVEITTTKGENGTLTYNKITENVNNQSGTELPSTGGIGTTLFYGVGGAMFLGALIMLVTKKRMKD